MKKIQLGGHREGSQIRGYSLVDDNDFEKLSKYNWSYSNGYAERVVTKKRIKMHRVIMNTPDEMETDHINGDKLDNRKENLRICTHAENQMNVGKQKNNTSGYKGVLKSGSKWNSVIMLNGKSIYLGRSEDKVYLAKLYDEAAKKYYGEFAFLNFP